jgi:hypothetical protein
MSIRLPLVPRGSVHRGISPARGISERRLSYRCIPANGPNKDRNPRDVHKPFSKSDQAVTPAEGDSPEPRRIGTI